MTAGRALLAAGLVLAAGAALRLAYPLGALALALPLLAMLAAFAAASSAARDRHRALKGAVVRPGSVVARLSTGRLGALAAGSVAALAVLPAAYFAVTAAGPELAAAGVAVPLAALVYARVRAVAARQVQPAFEARLAAAVTTLAAGLPLVLVLVWLGYAVVPPPAELAAPDLGAALALAAAGEPAHLVGRAVGAVRTGDIALWWAMDASGYRIGWLTALFLLRNALVGLAVARLTADICGLMARTEA